MTFFNQYDIIHNKISQLLLCNYYQKMNNPIAITTELSFKRTYTFCTLVTNYDEYMEMVTSAQSKGFQGDDVEFLYFDNQDGNIADGYSGINTVLKKAQGKYLIFCHQDIIFFDNDRAKLDSCLLELDKFDKNWAVAGNAGKTQCGDLKIRITEPRMKNYAIGDFPERVISLDENFLILNRNHSLHTSFPRLSGFHLYALDLCQNAISSGLNCYVIDFHLLHKSTGKLNQSYFAIEVKYKTIQYQRKQAQDFFAVCGHFYVSNFRFLNYLFNIKTIARWRRSYLKRFKK